MRYDAFISYAHSAGPLLAGKIELTSETLGRRWDEPRALDVCRELSEQGAVADLSGDLRARLDASEFFVLLGSPEAARSRWVIEEVEYWLASKGVQTILLVLIAGDCVWDDRAGKFDATRTTALPDALFHVYRSQPKWVDLRWMSEFPDDSERFTDCIAELSATIQGRGKDELVGVHQREQRKAVAQRAAQRATTLVGIDPEQSLLVAASASDLDDSPWTRAALVEVLESCSNLVAVLGTDGRVTALDVNPANDELLVGTSTGAVEVWTGSSGEQLRYFALRDGQPIHHLCYRADGRLFAAITGSSVVVADSYGRVLVEVSMKGIPELATLSPDGNALAVSARDGRDVVYGVWDLLKKRPRFTGRLPMATLRFVCFSPDGAALWLFAFHTMYSYDARTGDSIAQRQQPMYARGGPLGYARDGSLGALAQFDGVNVNLFRPLTYDISDSSVDLHGPGGIAERVAVSPDGSYVALSFRGRVVQWEVATGKVNNIRSAPAKLRELVLGPSGQMAMRNDSSAQLRDVRRWSALGTTMPVAPTDWGSSLQLAISGAFSPTGHRFAWVVVPAVFDELERRSAATVVIWSRNESRLETALTTGTAHYVAFASDDILVVGDLDGRLSWWNAATGEATRAPGAAPGTFGADQLVKGTLWRSPKFGPSFVLRADDRIVLQPLSATEAYEIAPPGDSIVGGPVPAQAADRFAFIRSGGVVEVHDLGLGLVDTLHVDDEPEFARLTLSPAGRLMAVWEIDGRVRVRDVDARVNIGEFFTRTADDIALVGGPTDGSLVVGDASGISIFDLSTQLIAGTFHAYPEAPRRRLVTSNDGTLIAECVAGGAATVWPLDPGVWREIARRIVGRALTGDERTRLGLSDAVFGFRTV